MNLNQLIAKYEELRAVPQADGSASAPDLWTVGEQLAPHIKTARAAGLDWTAIIAIIPMLLGILFPGLGSQFTELIQLIIKALLGQLT